MSGHDPSLSSEELPPVGDLVRDALADLQNDPVGLFLAGLGLQLGTVALILPIIVVGGGSFLLPALTASMFGEDSPLLLIAILAAAVIYSAVLIGGIAAIGCLSASLVRAVGMHVSDGRPLGFRAAFETVTTDAGKVMGLHLIVVVAAVLLLCVILLLFPLAWVVGHIQAVALVMVALEGRSPVDALQRAVKGFLAHPGWHMQILGVNLLIVLVGGIVPVVGAMLSVPVMYGVLVRAHRAVSV